MLEFINQFKEYLQSQNKSKNTIEGYLIDLRDFQLFTISEGLEDIALIEKSHIKDFLVVLMQNGNCSRSIARKVSSLKSFFKFLFISEIINSNPMKFIKNPKFEKKLPNFFSVKEMFQLCELPDKSTNTGIRDSAIIELFYSSGLRISELINIKIADLDLQNALLTIIGKGNKKRVIPVSDTALSKISEYLKIRIFFNPEDSKYLFISKTGVKFNRYGVYSILKKYINQIVSKSGYSPHTIRHSFASHLLQNGADLLSIKEMLGHSNLSTTEIYTHINPDILRREYLRGHPRSDKNK